MWLAAGLGAVGVIGVLCAGFFSCVRCAVQESRMAASKARKQRVYSMAEENNADEGITRPTNVAVDSQSYIARRASVARVREVTGRGGGAVGTASGSPIGSPTGSPRAMGTPDSPGRARRKSVLM